ncbi:MAG: 50S ribosomal protein L20 [Bacteroidetes bacterium]|jgi:large subunit ribosomal protein L20|nr:50S ribosomal protein L20 [Bacteroidota bacterium]PHX82896.1 MAG: 50S ribosomal protein L20 [Flavobacteriales bacterium]
MPRSVNHVASRAKRKKVLKMTKGYFGARKNVWTVAKNTLEKGLVYAYRDRKQKKRNFRSLWIQRINAGVREHGLSYSQFIDMANKKGVTLNRKTLADLAMNHPEAFAAVINSVK